MTPEQFSYLSTLAGVLPTLWVALAVIATPRRSLALAKLDRAIFLTAAVGMALVLPAIVEGLLLFTLSAQVKGTPLDPDFLRLVIESGTGITAGQAASIAIVLGFATVGSVSRKGTTSEPEPAAE